MSIGERTACDNHAVTVLVCLLAVVVALLGVLVAGLLRSHAEILRALHELGVGVDPDQPAAPRPGLDVPRRPPATRTAHDLAGVTPDGDALSVSVVGVDHPTLVAFLTSGCSTCAEFWTALDDVGRRHVPGDARLVVATKGPEAESPGRLRKFAPADVPVIMSSAAWDDFDVPVAPYFAYVDGPSGAVVGEGAASTWEHLQGMLEQALADAGMQLGRRRHRRGTSNRDREARADADLRRSGIEPGDPSLYPRTEADLHGRPDEPTPTR
jgi:hypothetical protein